MERAVDVITDRLRADILSLRLLPGSQLSEPKIAEMFNVSRQPVRDAFARLAAEGLLVCQPKKSTEVRRISVSEIQQSRFTRLSIELEIISVLLDNIDDEMVNKLSEIIRLQKIAAETLDMDKFEHLDVEFHSTMCVHAGLPFMAPIIKSEKAKVDRLCRMAAGNVDELKQLIVDHEKILQALKDKDLSAALQLTRKHLGRLDEVIGTTLKLRPAYFDN